MRSQLTILLCALAATPALAQIIVVEHFGSLAEVAGLGITGFEFHARADTQNLHLTRTDPPAHSEVPFDLWTSGVPHAFRVVFNADDITGIVVDDVYTLEVPVSINPATNAILVTAWVTAADGVVRVEDLTITLPDLTMYAVPDVAAGPMPDYLLITTDLPLAGGFILSGTVRFDWTGALPPPEEEWFEVTTAKSTGRCCDMNCDGVVNTFDIDPFVMALVSPAEYAAMFPNCNRMLADTNCDGLTNVFDIDPFVQCLIRGCQACE